MFSIRVKFIGARGWANLRITGTGKSYEQYSLVPRIENLTLFVNLNLIFPLPFKSTSRHLSSSFWKKALR